MRPSPLTLGGPALRAFLVAPLGAVATLGLIAVPYLVLEGERSLLERASTWGFFRGLLRRRDPRRVHGDRGRRLAGVRRPSSVVNRGRA